MTLQCRKCFNSLLIADIPNSVSCQFEMLMFKIVPVIKENIRFAFFLSTEYILK